MSSDETKAEQKTREKAEDKAAAKEQAAEAAAHKEATVTPISTPKPEPKKDMLSLFEVAYVERLSGTATPQDKRAYVVAKSATAAGDFVKKSAIVHKKVVAKDAQGSEQIVTPEVASIEITRVSSVKSDVQIAA